MLELNPGLILWTILTFLIVATILRMVAWKPLLGSLLSREEKIRNALHDAEQAHEEARRLLDEHRQQLARATEESQRIVREGREMGEKLRNEIVEKANTSSRTMIEQAKEEIRREKESALTQLRTEVADLAVAAAGRILDANLDAAKHKHLVDGAIQDMTKN